MRGCETWSFRADCRQSLASCSRNSETRRRSAILGIAQESPDATFRGLLERGSYNPFPTLESQNNLSAQLERLRNRSSPPKCCKNCPEMGRSEASALTRRNYETIVLRECRSARFSTVTASLCRHTP